MRARLQVLYFQKDLSMRPNHLIMSMLLSLAAPAWAGPFAVSPDGAEVTDGATGLVWKRCVEGMQWSGNACAGEAMAMTFDKARSHAQAVAASEKKPWRVPKLDELYRLVDKSQGVPTLDATAFPDTPAMQFWSANINAKEGQGHRAHFVFFATGESNEEVRAMPFYLRLVRGK